MGRMRDLLGDVPAIYPDRPGFERTSKTSRDAAASMATSAGSLRSKVLAFIRLCGVNGTTCDEVEAVLELRHQTASARIRELALSGSIVDAGLKRATRSGRQAVVYRCVEAR